MFKLQTKWLHSKPNRNYGDNKWALGFLTFKTLAEVERDWARALFLQAGAWSPYVSFQKNLGITSQPRNTPKLGRNGTMTYLWLSQVNQLCPHYKGINCLKLQMTVALKVCLRQLQISIHSGLKSRRNTQISTEVPKSLLRFPISYLCEAGFSAVTAAKMRLQSRLDISNTLWVSLSPINPRWDCLVAGKQPQDSHLFYIMVSCTIILLYITMQQ